ncbi:hypothetical protein NQ176_g7985 [Zarea fungicola]|uniref:Uncharacterized protein n=1 Tax=Zarea fungicola TaxID=93591 RepID=A0ACC1MV06_9HYPO|nr:hypothetical protein NQ176_g7985 [Lecanicillium fungicola]
MHCFNGYNPDTEVPDLSGKVILITGAHIYFTGRNQQAADAILAQFPPSHSTNTTRVTFIPCNMASLADIRAAAASSKSGALKKDRIMKPSLVNSDKVYSNEAMKARVSG